ncbi:MAG: DUF952 domain-containing protein [Hyphomonadaceae bacterium]|nr:DUF952 domain-containing protein [Hyphomonadaceae bacterium]
MRELVFKILRKDEWPLAAEVFEGSADDRRDGFIHLSTGAQVAGTLKAHFRGENDLLLLEIDAASLGPALKWEPSRGGALFPHLYGALPLSAVRSVTAINSGGAFADTLGA